MATPPGQYVLQWEQARLEAAVVDVFGFHALQLGHPALDGLSANRMPHRWLALDAQDMPMRTPADAVCAVTPSGDADEAGAPSSLPALFLHDMHLACDYDALPFPSNSLDLVVLPHTLEFARDPHQTLREVERVLVADGRVLIIGFNPVSLWGMRQRMGQLRNALGSQGSNFVPGHPEPIGFHRLRDWLRLLSFEVVGSEFGCWRPPLRSERGLERMRWLEQAGERWWPVLGAVYMVSAVKRVRGMHLIGLARKPRQAPMSAPAVATNRSGHLQHQKAKE